MRVTWYIGGQQIRLELGERRPAPHITHFCREHALLLLLLLAQRRFVSIGTAQLATSSKLLLIIRVLQPLALSDCPFYDCPTTPPRPPISVLVGKKHCNNSAKFTCWQGRRPDKKVGGGDNKMMYRTSIYAVYEYQTSKAGVIIESNFGGLRCFSLSLYSFSSPIFCPTFFKTRSLSLRAGVSRVLLSSPPSGSGRSPAAKRIKCVLLCIIMFNGWAKPVII